MYHFPEGFSTQACRNDLDADSASILLRAVSETFSNREAYIVPAYYLFIPLKGQKIFYEAGAEQTVEAGQLLLIRKGACVTCDVSRLDDGSFEAVMFLMDEAFIESVLKKYTISVPENLTERNLCHLQLSPFFKSCIESLLPYFISRSPRHEALIRLKMEELLLNLFESGEATEILSVIGHAAVSGRTAYQAFLEQWITEPVTIEQMAASLHQSPTAFKQSFKRHFGQPPAHYLQEKRLERAYQQVLMSQQNMTQIALNTGFESLSHFIQVFRKRYGLTPGQLKKSKLNKSPSESDSVSQA